MTINIDLRVKVTRDVAQYPLHHVTYVHAKFDVTTSNGLRGDVFTKKKKKKIFDLHWVKVTQNIAQYPLHHVTYADVKFEVATSNGLGGDAFTRKYII